MPAPSAYDLPLPVLDTAGLERSDVLTHIAAFGIAVKMLVATMMVHLPNGFFMN